MTEQFVVSREVSLDWARVDIQFMTSPSVLPIDKAVYGCLAAHCGTDERSPEEELSRKVLAKRVGCAVRTLDASLDRLETTWGVLEITRHVDPSNPKLNLPSSYRLVDSEWWDARAAERHAERQARKTKTPTRSAPDQGVVQELHQGGAGDAPGVVQQLHQGGAKNDTPSSYRGSPESTDSGDSLSGAEDIDEPADVVDVEVVDDERETPHSPQQDDATTRVAAAWAEAYTATTGQAPASEAVAVVRRDVAALLTGGRTADDLVPVAIDMAQKKPAHRLVSKHLAFYTPASPQPAPSRTAQRRQAADDLVAKFAAMEAAATPAPALTGGLDR